MDGLLARLDRGSKDDDQDFDANPFQTPFDFSIGTELTNVRCYLNGTSGIYWHFPSAVVVSTPQSAQWRFC